MKPLVRAASRMDVVQAPIIPVLGDIINAVPGTISLGQGVVHYGPPAGALDAAARALADPSTSEYQSGVGLPELVDAIAAKLAAENAIAVGRETGVIVTAGANMAFMHAVLAITEPGDEVVLPAPFYFNHEMAIQMAGCRAVVVPTDARYQLRLDAIEGAITERTRAVVTISPNNPTGAVLDAGALEAVNAVCRERGLYHVSDETYEYFVYEGRHVSPASLPAAGGHTISLFSLSKAYGFAGWRVGYMVYPADLGAALAKIQDTILICTAVVAQRAALAALQAGRGYSQPFVRELADVRRLVLDALATLHPLCETPPADGAFYCFLRVNTPLDPMTVAERLIREHKVAVVPGPAFGMTDGCSFRVSYGALQKATVAEGIGRLVKGLKAIVG
jgi:aspartate/methionine/tyrosine aminotransferase